MIFEHRCAFENYGCGEAVRLKADTHDMLKGEGFIKHVEISPHIGNKSIVIHLFFGNGTGRDIMLHDVDDIIKMFPKSNIKKFRKKMLTWLMFFTAREI